MNRKATVVLVNFLLVFALLFLIEGFLSYVSVGRAILTHGVTEREHTEYDEELGWINLPNLDIPDMYGQGDFFTTNSQRYRASYDFSREVPDGKIRIICSGDSFTLGFGVDDDHTWCHLLTEVDKGLETVNMGQGGYGVDQAYLWYKRDEKKLEHDIVIFAFITGDFLRMQSDTFIGYGKPYLTIKDGELLQENFPVLRESYERPWLTNDLYALRQLHSVKLLSGAFERISPKEEVSIVKKSNEHTEKVVSLIFADLQQTSRSKQRFAVFVYLPTRQDYTGSGEGPWRRYVQEEVDRNGYIFVDLVEEIRTLPPHRIDALFRKGGHYTAEGNRYVAEVIHDKLTEKSVLPDKF